MVAAGERDEYYPILLAEPLSRNQSLLGYDLASDAAFRAAFHEAAADRPTVVDYLPWNGNKEADRSLLYVVEPVRYESVSPAARPADQPELDGIVLGVFRVSAGRTRPRLICSDRNRRLHHPAQQKGPEYADLHAAVSLPCGRRRGPARRHSGRVCPRKHPPIARYRSGQHAVDRAVRSHGVYLARHQTWEPLGTLLAGLFITGLLVGYFHLLAGRRARVERLVAECWRELPIE